MDCLRCLTYILLYPPSPFESYRKDVRKVVETRQTGENTERLVQWKQEWATFTTELKPSICLYAGTVTQAHARHCEGNGRGIVYLCTWSNLTTPLWTPKSVASEYLNKETLVQAGEAQLKFVRASKRKKKTPEFWDVASSKKRRSGSDA